MRTAKGLAVPFVSIQQSTCVQLLTEDTDRLGSHTPTIIPRVPIKDHPKKSGVLWDRICNKEICAQYASWHTLYTKYPKFYNWVCRARDLSGPPSHRRQTGSLLPDDSAAAQEACDHHQATSQDEDVGSDSKRVGGQETQVPALLHQCPDTYTQNSCSAHLKEWVEVMGRVRQSIIKRSKNSSGERKDKKRDGARRDLKKWQCSNK